MKNYQSACLFLAVLSAAGCSKTVNTSGQPGLPGQVDNGQETGGSPDPQPTLTPTATPSIFPSVTPSASPSVTPTTTTGDALKVKYESATLRCDLEFPLEYNYVIADVKSFGSDSFTWDLLKDYPESKKFELSAKTFRKDLIVDFNVESVAFESTNKNANTLVVSGAYSFESATPISFFKTKSAVMGNGPFEFYENSETRLVDEYVGFVYSNTSDEYGVVLNCVLNTKLKTATSATMTE